jgi:hypothetical protein
MWSYHVISESSVLENRVRRVDILQKETARDDVLEPFSNDIVIKCFKTL